MATLLVFVVLGGLLTGGAMGAVRRSGGSRKGWLTALAMATMAGLCLLVAIRLMRDL